MTIYSSLKYRLCVTKIGPVVIFELVFGPNHSIHTYRLYLNPFLISGGPKTDQFQFTFERSLSILCEKVNTRLENRLKQHILSNIPSMTFYSITLTNRPKRTYSILEYDALLDGSFFGRFYELPVPPARCGVAPTMPSGVGEKQSTVLCYQITKRGDRKQRASVGKHSTESN